MTFGPPNADAGPILMSIDDRDLIVKSLLRLIADQVVMTMRVRILQLRSASLGLKLHASVWDTTDVDPISDKLASEVARMGGEVPFDLSQFLTFTSFDAEDLLESLDTESEILEQLVEDRRQIVENALFLCEVFEDIEDTGPISLVRAIVDVHWQAIVPPVQVTS